jgi:hypothetical protein
MQNDYETLMAQRSIMENSVQAAGGDITGGGCTMSEHPVADFSYITPDGDEIWVEIRRLAKEPLAEWERDILIQAEGGERGVAAEPHWAPGAIEKAVEDAVRLAGKQMSREQIRRILADDDDEPAGFSRPWED